TKLVQEPLQRTSTPYIIAAMWGLWALAFGLESLGLLLFSASLPSFALEMQRAGAAPMSSQEIQVLQSILFLVLFFTSLMTMGALAFVVSNIARWGCAFYANIAAALLFMTLQMCSLAGAAGGGGSEIAGGAVSLFSVVTTGICFFGPPILVIALTVFARGDYQKQTYAVVVEDEQLRTGDAADYYNRGLRRSKRGKLNQAVADWEVAVRLDPGDPAFRNVLALGYAEQKRFDEAIVQLEAALQISPHDPITLENMEIVRGLQAGAA
ncbi:MAG: hypothetical protein KKB13_16315, partial [Chloroflexi bacterium]|nr:hypothetical protein [Chloroflexota bacterium]